MTWKQIPVPGFNVRTPVRRRWSSLCERPRTRAVVLRRSLPLIGIVVALAATSPARAENEDFQDFFANLCAGSGAPIGVLAERCAATGSGAGDGDLSGDSESSLNPSQTLSSHDASLADARSMSKETRERGERVREGEASLGDEAESATFGRWSLLAHLRGEGFDTERNPGGDPERGYDGDQQSFEVGVDYRVSDVLTWGGIVTVERLDSDFDRDLQEGAPFDPASTAGSIETESTNLTLFASYVPAGRLYFDGAVGLLSTDYTFRRNSVFQESGRSDQVAVRTEGTPDGTGWWASANLGHETQRGGWSLGPYGGIVVASSKVDAYTELDLNNSGLAMQIGETNRDSVLAHLGFGASYAISTRGGVWVPQFRLEWNHEFDNDPLDVVTSYALDEAGTEFGLLGEEPDEDYFSLKLALVGVRANGWFPFVDVEALLGYEDFNRYRLTLGLRKDY